MYLQGKEGGGGAGSTSFWEKYLLKAFILVKNIDPFSTDFVLALGEKGKLLMLF